MRACAHTLIYLQLNLVNYIYKGQFPNKVTFCGIGGLGLQPISFCGGEGTIELMTLPPPPFMGHYVLQAPTVECVLQTAIPLIVVIPMPRSPCLPVLWPSNIFPLCHQQGLLKPGWDLVIPLLPIISGKIPTHLIKSLMPWVT